MKAKRFIAGRINAADVSADPKWNMLFPIGTWSRRDFPGGKFNFTAEWFGKVLANWKSHGSPALPVDYNHEDQDVASGWIEDLDVRADGLYGLIKWNAPAMAHLKADEFRYISPSWAFNSKDRHAGVDQGPELYGAALLNDPFFDEMPRVAASRSTPAAPAEDTTMNKKNVCQLLAGMGYAVNDNDSDDAINAALEKACTAKAWNHTEKVTAALEPLKTQLTEAQSALKVAAEANKTQASRIEALEKAKTDAELTGLVKELIDGAHIIAAQAEQVKTYAKATSVADARTFFSAMKAHALSGEKGMSGNPAENDLTPDAAFAKLGELARERAKAEKISVSEAKRLIYDEPEFQGLVAKANRNTAPEKRN